MILQSVLMCGRYTLMKLADLLKLIPWLQVPAGIIEQHQPRYNVAPSQTMPIIADEDGHATLRMANWGFVPSWTRGKPKTRPINAKAETVATSGMFRKAFQQRRCLVPADGFYEWQGNKPPKQPYLIRMRDHGLIAFAGLWERWHPDDAEPVDTFTIITTTPNELMARIHNRMPVIIPQERCSQWLGAGEPRDLMKPLAAEAMDAIAVSTRVNNPRFDGPECVEASQAVGDV